MLQERLEFFPKMVKSKKEPITPRRRTSIGGAIGKVKRVLSRPVSNTKPCVTPSANIKVVVRVRPQNDREQENLRNVVKIVDDQMLIFDPKEDDQGFFFHGVQQKSRDMLKKANKDITFVFDKVFSNDSTNLEVFMNSTKSLIDTLMNGYNCSVFAYGATGAGKTFTMIGTADSPGITFLTLQDLFKRKEELSSEREFELMVTYIEVYNELVKDLLNPGAPLNLREDVKYGVLISGVKGHKINNPDDLFSLLEQGNKRRTQHPTDANSESSRSHAVFQVYIQMTIKGSREIRRAKLSMIDLAGSERGSATGYVGARFKEGANINKSLLALGNCINSLADGKSHVPYRDSKLTRLLKDSLGGNCHTIMIANVSPSCLSFDDTYNTLKYAMRAKSIKSSIKRNIVNVDMHVDQYIKLVDDLQTENSNLKSENATLKTDQDCLKKEIESLKEQVLLLSSQKENLTAKENCQETGIKNDLDPVILENSMLKRENEILNLTINTLKTEKGEGDGQLSFASTVNVKQDSLKDKYKDTKPEIRQTFKKIIDQQKEMLEREFQLQSSAVGMALRRELKTETNQRLSSIFISSADKEEAHRKINDQVERYEKKEKVAHIRTQEFQESREDLAKELQHLISVYVELTDEYEKCMLELKLLDSQHKYELKEKENEILLDDHKEKCNTLEKMAALIKKLFLAVGGRADAPESVKLEYEKLLNIFQGKKNLTWQDDQVSQDSNSDVNSKSSLQNNLEVLNRASKRKIETGSTLSLDSTFTTANNGLGKTQNLKSGKASQIVAKAFKAPAPKRLANGISPRNKENKLVIGRSPIRPDSVKTIINARKYTTKRIVDRPVFKK